MSKLIQIIKIFACVDIRFNFQLELYFERFKDKNIKIRKKESQ